MNDSIGILALKLPLDLAPQRDPSLGHCDIKLLDRDERVPFQRARGGRRNVGVVALGGAGEPDLDVVGDRLHAADTMSSLLGGESLGVRLNPTRQRDDTVLDGHADLVRLDPRFPFQFCQDVALDLNVRSRFSCHCHFVAPGSGVPHDRLS